MKGPRRRQDHRRRGHHEEGASFWQRDCCHSQNKAQNKAYRAKRFAEDQSSASGCLAGAMFLATRVLGQALLVSPQKPRPNALESQLTLEVKNCN